MIRYQQGLVVIGMMIWLSGCQNGAGISSEHETQNQSAELVMSSEYQEDVDETTEMQPAASVQSESQPTISKPTGEIPETAVALNFTLATGQSFTEPPAFSKKPKISEDAIMMQFYYKIHYQ